MRQPPHTGSGQMWIGHRLTILQPSVNPMLEEGTIPIQINPGSAFGTGTHPTTRLCLLALERHLKPGSTVLDLGTGTGILAIAAAKLDSGRVLAVDIDPDAVNVARGNVSANNEIDRIRVEQGSLADVLDGQWGLAQADLVIANILLHVIGGFFEQGLTRAMALGGVVILSGILSTQTSEIRAHLQWNGLALMAQEQMDEWACIIARRR